MQVARINRDTRQYTKMMMMILLPMLLGGIPLQVLWSLSYSINVQHSLLYNYAHFGLSLIFVANRFINPIYYCWFNPKFRKAYLYILSAGRYNKHENVSVPSVN